MRRVVLAVAAAGLLAGCGVKEEIYKRDVNTLKDQIAELESSKDALVGEKKRLNDELLALGREKGSLSSSLESALKRVEELRLQAEKRRAKIAELRGKLQAMVTAGQLKIRTDKGRLLVELAERVLFDVGKYKLKPEGEAALAQLTAILKTLEGRNFQIAGHTDSTGSDETNWRLSANRALEVALFMVKEGMDPVRLSAAGYGKFQPVAENDTPENQAQNRRIEVVLVPNVEELMGFEDE